jgi:hypothetical protein
MLLSLKNLDDKKSVNFKVEPRFPEVLFIAAVRRKSLEVEGRSNDKFPGYEARPRERG